MKRLLLLLSFLLINTPFLLAQVKYEPGYLININGERSDGLIKNYDRVDNPKIIEFKSDEIQESTTISPDQVQEFQFHKGNHYISRLVHIDRSSNDIDALSEDRRPDFREERLFLKVLVSGKASLYSYIEGATSRYFYQLGQGEIRQLIHKRFITEENTLGENNRFRQQLWNEVNTNAYTYSRIQKLHYNTRDLVAYFKVYNGIEEPTRRRSENTTFEDRFQINLRSGGYLSSLEYRYYNPEDGGRATTRQMDNTSVLSAGAELEYYLPFNKKKWVIIAESAYQDYSGESSYTEVRDLGFNGIKTVDIPVIVNYTAIEVAAGVRHYMYLQNGGRIFLNSSLIQDILLNGEFTIEGRDEVQISPRLNIAFGIGYKFRKLLALEMRYQPNHDLLGDHITKRLNFSNLGLILGVNIL